MPNKAERERLAAGFQSFLQEYSCKEECRSLGMTADDACNNFVQYYKLILIVLWRQALEYVLPKDAGPVFKLFMNRLQQALPASQRKQQTAMLRETLGSVSSLLQQEQGVVQLAEQCVSTFASPNGKDPATMTMLLTRRTLEHLQRSIGELTLARDKGFTDIANALAAALGAGAEGEISDMTPAAPQMQSTTPKAPQPEAEHPEAEQFEAAQAEAAEPEGVGEATSPGAGDDFLQRRLSSPQAAIAASDVPGDLEQAGDSPRPAWAWAASEVEELEAAAGTDAVEEDGAELEANAHEAASGAPLGDEELGEVLRPVSLLQDAAPAAIVPPLAASAPEPLDLDPPPLPTSAGESHEGNSSDEASEEISIILGDDDMADVPLLQDAEETLELDLDTVDASACASMPEPPPESFFEKSDPPPRHISGGLLTPSPPLERPHPSPLDAPPSRPAGTRSTPSMKAVATAAVSPASSRSAAGQYAREGAPEDRAPLQSPPEEAGRERRRGDRVSARILSVLISHSARQLGVKNISASGLAVYHEGWTYEVGQTLTLDLLGAYNVLLQDLQCTVVRTDDAVMACRFTALDNRSECMLQAIVNRIKEARRQALAKRKAAQG